MSQLLEIWPILVFLLLQLGGLVWFLSSMKERVQALEESRCSTGKTCTERIDKCEKIFDGLKEMNNGQNLKINTLETTMGVVKETIRDLQQEMKNG